jgi:D-alanyl-D-alanine carboxypeptidase
VVVLVVALGMGVGGGAWVGMSARTAPLRPAPTPTGEPRHPPPQTTPVTRDTMLAWTPNGLPAEFARGVSRLPGVAHAVPVVSGIAWLTQTTRNLVPERPPRGFAYPVEVAGARLADYAPFLDPGNRPLFAELRKGAGLLGQMSARIRQVEPGDTATLWFRSHGHGIRRSMQVPVAGIVPDASVGANEVFVSRRTAVQLGLRTERYVLIDPAPEATRARLEQRIRALLPGDIPLRIRGPGETPYFRQGDAVLPQVRMKELFGEFAARSGPGGSLVIDPAWTTRHIVSTHLPLVGDVSCNRAIVPQVRGALREIAASGLGQLVNPQQFGGCFSPRFTNRIPNAGLSHHAWGTALDVNVAANPYGRAPTQDRRLVAIFSRWGFTWGGRFLIPDGMHFDFIRFASGS